jgi:hypothetical protein
MAVLFDLHVSSSMQLEEGCIVLESDPFDLGSYPQSESSHQQSADTALALAA